MIPNYYDKNKIKIIGISLIIDNYDDRVYSLRHFSSHLFDIEYSYYSDEIIEEINKLKNLGFKDPPYNYYFSYYNKKLPFEPKLKLLVTIFNDEPNIEKKFEVYITNNDSNKLLLKENYKNFSLLLFSIQDFIFIFIFESIYQISLKNNEIVSIFETDKYYLDKCISLSKKSGYELLKDIKEKNFIQNIPNFNLKKLDEFSNFYAIFDRHYFFRKENTKNNLYNSYSDSIFKDKKLGQILFIDYEGARIIKTKDIDICINIKNKNTIIVNNKYIYHSIINSNLYRVIFLMFIKDSAN